jgi:hypothetical protein
VSIPTIEEKILLSQILYDFYSLVALARMHQHAMHLVKYPWKASKHMYIYYSYILPHTHCSGSGLKAACMPQRLVLNSAGSLKIRGRSPGGIQPDRIGL